MLNRFLTEQRLKSKSRFNQHIHISKHFSHTRENFVVYVDFKHVYSCDSGNDNINQYYTLVTIIYIFYYVINNVIILIHSVINIMHSIFFDIQPAFI